MSSTLAHGTLAIPEAAGMPTTSLEDCDRAVADVAAHADEWMQLPAAKLVPLVDSLIDRTLAVSDAWVAAAHQAKRIDPTSPTAGEDWANGIAPTVRYLRLLVRSLQGIATDGNPPLPGKPGRAHGRVTVPAYPIDALDRVLLPGFTAEVWLQPEVRSVSEAQAPAWHGKGTPGVSVVLGAGNVSAIPVTDALDKLFVHRHPVVLKMNPVNDYIGPYVEQALAPLVERGVLRIVYGGAEVGTRLVRAPEVVDVHVTGSDKTYDVIVWGPGEEGKANKAADTPVVTKPVTAELGNVTPVIVVPGPWTAADLAYQGQNLSVMLTNNAGFNCIATRVIVTHEGWDRRSQLLDQVRASLRATPTRFPYYPGASERLAEFVDGHPQAERFGAGELPWALVPDVSPKDTDDICFTTESFAGVFAETALPAASPADFVREAVRFANDELWGTLACTILVHPKSLKDPATKAAVDQAIADLRYGTVAVNQWSALNFALGSTTWGAYPGHDVHDIRSGIGVVHNALMLDRVEKTVMRGPWRMRPKPPWFASHKRALPVFRTFAKLQGRPSLKELPAFLMNAARG